MYTFQTNCCCFLPKFSAKLFKLFLTSGLATCRISHLTIIVTVRSPHIIITCFSKFKDLHTAFKPANMRPAGNTFHVIASISVLNVRLASRTRADIMLPLPFLKFCITSQGNAVLVACHPLMRRGMTAWTCFGQAG